MRKSDLSAAANKAVVDAVSRAKARFVQVWNIAQYILPLIVAAVTALLATSASMIEASAEQRGVNLRVSSAIESTEKRVEEHGVRIGRIEVSASAAMAEHIAFKESIKELKVIASQQVEIAGKLDIVIRLAEHIISAGKSK